MDPDCIELVNQLRTLVKTERAKSTSDKWLTQFQMYREEDRHECNLIASRFNVLLYSESVLAAVGGFLYEKDHYGALLVTAALAFLLSGMTCIAIFIGCRVLAAWHQHGTMLIDAVGKEDGPLDRYFLAGRNKMPDIQHKVSIDYFSCSVPIVFGVAWFLVIEYVSIVRMNRGWGIPTICLVMTSLCWAWGMKWVGDKTKNLHKHKEDANALPDQSSLQIGAGGAK